VVMVVRVRRKIEMVAVRILWCFVFFTIMY
jgi:hypothetical protein